MLILIALLSQDAAELNTVLTQSLGVLGKDSKRMKAYAVLVLACAL